jgi:hypothetical protein
MSYEAMALLTPGNAVTLADVEDKLSQFYSRNSQEVQFSRQDGKLQIRLRNWSCTLIHNSDSSVIKESQEMATLFATNRPDKAIIASCDSRYEIECAPDPNMENFNEFIFILEQLDSFADIKVWEAATQEFI